uniref:VWFA domain-containing protein n=1 Tax=Panagrellus redivivus TaxID=6233 RepID=A0A7E4VV57_PANRE
MAHEDRLDLLFRIQQLPINAYQGYRVLLFAPSEPDAPQHPQDVEIGRTEKRFETGSVAFAEPVRIVFRLGTRQDYKAYLALYQPNSEEIERIAGQANFSIFQVLKNTGTLTTLMKFEGFDLNSVPLLTVQAQTLQEVSNGTVLQFAGHHLHSQNRHPIAPYFVLSVASRSGGGNAIHLYRSEVETGRTSPQWKQFVVPTKFLTILPDSELIISCFNYNNNTDDTLIGRYSTTFFQLLSGASKKHILVSAAGRKAEEMSLEVTHVGSNPIVSPLSTILASGTQLHFTLAIDYTTHNGLQTEPNSLHFQHPHHHSPYATRLQRITSNLETIGTSKVSLLGFGAKDMTSCFALNGNIANSYSNVSDVLSWYRQASLTVQLYGPTNYADIISLVKKQAIAAEQLNRSMHFVLVILTNGNLVKQGAFIETVDQVAKASRYPMSIIFVGVGNDAHKFRNEPDSGLQRLALPTVKSHDKASTNLQREVVTIIDSSDDTKIPALPSEIYNAMSRHMIMWKLRR